MTCADQCNFVLFSCLHLCSRLFRICVCSSVFTLHFLHLHLLFCMFFVRSACTYVHLRLWSACTLYVRHVNLFIDVFFIWSSCTCAHLWVHCIFSIYICSAGFTLYVQHVYLVIWVCFVCSAYASVHHVYIVRGVSS